MLNNQHENQFKKQIYLNERVFGENNIFNQDDFST